MRQWFKNVNVPFWMGSVILCFLLFVMVFPSVLTDRSPYTVQQLRFSTEEGKFEVDKAPFPPSDVFFMGTDDLGRDIWSYIVYGTKTTILLGVLTALCQFAVAFPLALLGGTGHVGIRSFIKSSNVLFSAIPALLIAIIILQIDFFSSLNRMHSQMVFVLVLTMVGWPKLGMLLTERIEYLVKQPFILGAEAIGKKKWRIRTDHLLPHVLPEAIVLFFMEVARNLSMMMQLGLFSVFIGNLRLVLDSQNGRLVYYNISYEPEWASMLSTSRTYLTLAPWTVLFPALAFFVSVLGFNLFGEGLRTQLDSAKRFSRKWLGVLACVVLLLSVDFQALNAQPVKWTETAFSQEKIVFGTEESLETAQRIANAMEALGMRPAVGEEFISAYALNSSTFPLTQAMSYGGTPFVPNVDFLYLSGEGSAVQGEIVDATAWDLITLEDFGAFENQFVLLDSAYYSDAFIHHWIEKANRAARIKGVILIDRYDETLKETYTGSATVIKVTRSTGEQLKSPLSQTLTTSATFMTLTGQGHNIIGIYEGTEPSLKEEYIAIGLNYNYLEDTKDAVLQFNMTLMEALCGSENNRRSLLFVFTDGTLKDANHGIFPFANDTPMSPQKVKVYLDLTGLGLKTPLSFSAKQAPPTRQFAWSLGQMLQDALAENAMPVRSLKSVKNGAEFWFLERQSNNAMFWDAGIASVVLIGEVENLETLADILVKVIHKNNY